MCDNDHVFWVLVGWKVGGEVFAADAVVLLLLFVVRWRLGLCNRVVFVVLFLVVFVEVMIPL
jgi:hypothetical protein